jgi:hypothetical protein
MPPTFSVEHDGRHVELVTDSLWEADRVRLLVDGEAVAETKANGPRTVLAGTGFEVRAVMPWWGGSVIRAELVPEAGEPVRLEPEPGTRAARRAAFERAHPRLYAARHVVKGAGQVALALIGLSLLLKFLPDITLPSIPLPRIDLPDIPWPSIELPSIELPGWVKTVLQTKQYWLPIVVGVALAAGELRRRRVRSQDARARDAARPRTGPPA